MIRRGWRVRLKFKFQVPPAANWSAWVQNESHWYFDIISMMVMMMMIMMMVMMVMVRMMVMMKKMVMVRMVVMSPVGFLLPSCFAPSQFSTVSEHRQK